MASIKEHLDVQFPYVLTAVEGQRFGGTDHYDESCLGTFSMQYTGHKRWTFWAPWDLGTIKAHDRFETDIGPGEVVMY